jgi:RiboL-PSP-HEPN
MIGRAEIESRRTRLNAAFARASASAPEPELQADLARHLCILVSGFFEKALVELLVTYARGAGSPALRSHVQVTLERLTNVNKKRLLDTVGGFDAGWRAEYDSFISDEREAALNSVVALRNNIAHGGGASITLARITSYWNAIQEIIDHLENKFDPLPRTGVARRPR